MSAAIIDELSLPDTEAPEWMPSEDISQKEPIAPVVEPPKSATANVAPTSVKAPSVAPSKPKPEVEDSPRPMIVVDANSNPIGITLIYLSHDSFVHDYRTTLHTSAITVDHPGLTQLYHPVRLRIQFANGDVMEVMGQMVAQLPTGMAIALELDASQREHLRQHSES